MSTTKEFGKEKMSFLKEVGKNVDLANDKLLAALNARFPNLSLTRQLALIPVKCDNEPHLRR